MSHLHLSDGLLSISWVLVWSAAALLLLGLALLFLRRSDFRRLAPRVGIFAALLLLVMSFEWLGVYHMNLTSLAAIVMGPWAAVLVLFIVNLALSLIGHGGLTTYGLSTLILCAEALSSYGLFRLFSHRSGRAPRAAFAATLVSLMISFAFMVVSVSASLGSADWLHRDDAGQQGVLSWRFLESHDEEAMGEEPDHEEAFSWRSFLQVMALPGLIGWPLEALLVGGLVRYIGMARPDLIQTKAMK